ncbi:MAG: DUF1501 domain-containing protein [Rhodothermales bacterium]|nr:DUF1501 domain-containing protein [Rhodothermales bacterium]
MSEATNKQTGREGSCLSHGDAHAGDHSTWSRRSFLSTMGMTVGGTVAMGGLPISTYGKSPLLRALGAVETDRILVLIQLNGGNDGLNTVIPVENDIYYANRPGIAIAKSQATLLSPEVGLHPSLSGLKSHMDEGRLAVVQGVGYPEPNLSHFRSTDIWVSASDSDVVQNTGWMGRYLDADFPDFGEQPPEYPLAVQVGGLSSMIFQGPSANMGMSLASVQLFSQIAETGLVYDVTNLPNTAYGNEMEFVRSVANDSFLYASAVQDAASNSGAPYEYPSPNPLADSLAVIAQLIKGNLGSRIYVASLGSFDTHAGQPGPHATLLRYISEALTAFYADLEIAGMNERVMAMTFSEFGRRVNQNGSGGTDHGTAAPLFVLGGGVSGGLLGAQPDLTDLDLTGNMKFEEDFRSIYSTVLTDWFGLPETATEQVLGGSFDRLDFVADPAVPTSTVPEAVPEAFALRPAYPNPFSATTTLSYTLARPSHVDLSIFDVQGRMIQRVVDRQQTAGSYSMPFDAGRLPSGTYVYRLTTDHGSVAGKMAVVK